VLLVFTCKIKWWWDDLLTSLSC